MAVVRWDPTRDVDVLQREMNRLFDDVFTPSSRRKGLADKQSTIHLGDSFGKNSTTLLKFIALGAEG